MARRPLDGARRITGDRASHAEYKVESATDYGADHGEVIRAPISGTVARWWSTTGGNSVGVTTSRWRITIQHLSAYAASTGKRNEGAAIGYVGNTGTATTGPHVHGFVIDRWTGKRYSIEEWLVKFFGFTTAKLYGSVAGPFKYGASSLKPAADGGTKIIEEPEETENMDMIYRTIQVVDVPGIAGVRSPTFKDANTYLVFADTWYLEIERYGTESKSWSTIIGKGPHAATESDFNRVKKQIDSLPKASTPVSVQAPTVDYGKLAAAIAPLIKTPSAAEIAKAVNDDAAARLKD